MSKTLSSVAMTQFDSSVKQAFQGSGKLRGTVTIRANVTGDTYKFRAIGKGLAVERTAPSSDAIPMNVDHSLIPCTLGNWEANEYTDIFDAKTVNFSEVKELGTVIASALGRRADQLILDQLALATTVIGDGTGALNLDLLRATKKAMDQKGVPTDGRTFVISADGLSQLLGSTEVTNSDYNSVKTLVNGEVNTFLGFKFITLEDRVEGGLPLHYSYAYHNTAVGCAIGMDIKTNVDWIPVKKSWLSAGNYKSGAVIRDDDGIVKINYLEVA